MHRRRLLQHAAASASAAWFVPFVPSHAAAQARAPIALGPAPAARFDDVDHFERLHALRDGAVPVPAEPTERCDVVVIGGGLAGLVSAYRLRQRKLIVLEKEDEFGGNSRARELAGCRYALGAFVSQGPIAPFTGFFDEVGARFLPLKGSDHALHSADTLVRDPFGAGLAHLPWPAHERRALAAALERLRPLLDPKEGIFFPFEQNTQAMRAYDRRTQWQAFDEQALPPRVRELFDALLSARIGDSGQHLSAWYGSYLLSNLLAPSYTMRGGHGDLSLALVQHLRQAQPQALRPGFTVLRVQNLGPDEVRVTGVARDGTLQTIAARCAVVSAPKHVAKHLVPELRGERADAYAGFHYNAYLVAQVMLERRIRAPYETIAPQARLARFVVAPDALPGNQRRDGGGLLTVYAPFPRVSGRLALQSGEAQALAQHIVEDLHLSLPEAAAQVEAIALHRWGHPMLTATPGMGAALEEARRSEGRIAFAHSDNLGITGLYSAVWAGMEAESEVELMLG
jgi:protoporphyrinogen/coproporphyrinogen III oxidase